MVLRKAFEQIDRAGRWWETVTIGAYSTPTRSRREAAELRALLAAVVADWPPDAPPTPALDAAREYLRRAEGSEA